MPQYRHLLGRFHQPNRILKKSGGLVLLYEQDKVQVYGVRPCLSEKPFLSQIQHLKEPLDLMILPAI